MNVIEDKIFDIAAKTLECSKKKLNGDSNRETVPSWDSLQHMKLLLSVENAFNIRFSPEEISKIENLADLINAVQRTGNDDI
jgi:acyl carrier protein